MLGGSIGHALRAAGFTGTRVGVGRRQSSLDSALERDAVDEVTLKPVEGVIDADVVILCTPIGHFESMLAGIAEHLKEQALVTDVGSTKTEVVRLATRILPSHVRFVGSHPMAGGEKTGVEYARADLFERALCLVTPTASTPAKNVTDMEKFWQLLGGHTMTLSPARHDSLLARVSHLPHAVATALVNLSIKGAAIDLAGPGFADVTRIASGDPAMWTDIFRTNRSAMLKAIDQLMTELTRLRNRLDKDETAAIEKWLTVGKEARDEWVANRYRKKVLPP